MIPDFYISSSEGHMEGEARSCFVIKRMNCAGRDDCLLIKVSPPLKGEQYGLEPSEIRMVIVLARLKSNSVVSPSKWPVPVYVLYASITNVEELSNLSEEQYKLIAWAEIYKDKEQAPRSNRYTFG